MKENWQKYLAEAFGTAALVFVAAGAALVNRQTGGSLGTVGMALVSGLAYAGLIYSTWHISGANLNPAITVSLWATGYIKTLVALGYILAQLVGAIVGAIIVKNIFIGASAQFFLGSTMLGNGITPGLAILVETVFTFLLAWTVFASTSVTDKKSHSGFGAIASGAMLAVGIMLAGELTMGSMNPARSFGPAIVSSYWENQYVYWIGPILGALVAGGLHRFAFKE